MTGDGRSLPFQKECMILKLPIWEEGAHLINVYPSYILAPGSMGSISLELYIELAMRREGETQL